MRKIGSKKRFALIATTTAAVLVGSGVAFAYWTTTGSGTGSATAGNSSTVTVNQTGAAITGLYPGGPAVAVPFNIVNGNVSGQYIATVALSVSGTRNGVVAQPGCTAADFTVTAGTIGAVVPSGTTNYPTGNGATIKMIDTGVNQNLCKTVTVDLAFAAS